MAIREAQLGPDHPGTAQSLNNLGVVLADLGELPAARDHFERALAIREARLGLTHADTVTVGQRLASVVDRLAARTEAGGD